MPKLKILKEDELDIDSTDIWRFSFHSGYPVLKIAASGSATFKILAGNNFGEHVVTHSLGYMPIYFANIGYGGKSYQVPANITPINDNYYIEVPNEAAGDSIINFYSSVDGNTLAIGASTADGVGVLNDVTFTAYWIINLDEF